MGMVEINEGGKMEQTIQLEKLSGSDYVKDDSGCKVVSWDGLDKRIRNLNKLQNINRPILKQFINSLGYEIIKEWRENDGWGDTLNIDHFQIKDRRDGSKKHITGSDDNSAIFEVMPSGGRGLWKSVPNTIAWCRAEKGAN